MAKTKTKTNGKNGNGFARNSKGHFAPGNKGGPGNPLNKKTHEFRRLLLESTTDEEALAVWSELKAKAMSGQPWAIRELLDRIIGKANQPLDIRARTEADEMGDDLVEFLRARSR